MTDFIRRKWQGLNGNARISIVLLLAVIGATCLYAAHSRIEQAKGKKGFKLDIQTVKGASSYVQIWATTSLMDQWKVVALDWGKDNGQSWLDANEDASRYYKVVEIPIDAPADSDGDGMDDVYEMRHPHLDPLDGRDAKRDCDGDGLLNIQEYQTEKARGPQKIIIDAVSVVPVPSPTEISFSIYSQYRVRPTDAHVGAARGRNDKRYYVRQILEVFSSAGEKVRTITQDFLIDPTGIKNASEYVAITTSSVWNGKDDSGMPVPDDVYTIRIHAQYIRVAKKVKIIDTCEPLEESLTLEVDLDGDGMADWWEEMYLGGTNASPTDDPDGDGVNNLSEYLYQTDPKARDTDRDGFEDGFEPGYGVSRAFIEWGHTDFTIGDDYVYTMPDWLVRAYRIGGEWVDTLNPGPLISFSLASSGLFTNPVDLLTIDWEHPTAILGEERIYVGDHYLLRRYINDKGEEVLQEVEAPITWKQAETLCKENPLLLTYITHLLEVPGGPVFNPSEWHVEATEPDGIGSLNIEIDRSIVTTDLKMEIKLIDHAGSSLYVDLLSSNYTVIASDIYGNIITDTDLMLWKTNDVPLEANPSAAVIRLRRGTGEITVGEMILYIDQDGDHLDAGQEALLGTSDLSGDSDGDGTGDYEEVQGGTDPTNSALFLAGISGTVSYSGAVTRAVTLVASQTNSIATPFRSQVSGSSLPSAYSITNLPTLNDYWAFAFLDMNGNSSNECWEPAGVYAGNPVSLAGDTSGINISLIDPPDTDLDGMPDCWEQYFFGDSTSADPAVDQEGDGLNNLQEYRQSCDPFNPDSNGDGIYDGGGWISIRNTSLQRLPSGEVKLFISYPDNYTNRLDVFACTNLLVQDWVLATTVNSSLSTNRISWTDPESAVHRIRFYQAWNADYDQDSDGLSDGRERRLYGTDPTKMDSDGDGLNDPEEILTYGMDPLDNDQDSDGIKDGWELQAFGNLAKTPSSVVLGTIQDALDAAANDTVVLVPSGTYTGPGNKDLDFKGKRVVLVSENGPETTIIDCDNSGRGFDFHSEETAATVLNGFTIRNGLTNDGAGIRIFGSSPAIRNCILENNSATNLGGAIYSVENTYIHHWDGIEPRYWIIGASPIIEGCIFKRNSAPNAGAIFLSDESQDAVDGYAGVGYLDRHVPGLANIRRCRLLKNSAPGADVVSIESTEAVIENCAVAGNTGRGIHNSLGKLTLRNCTISENKFTGNGSGVYATHGGPYPGYTKLQNTIVWGNSADEHQTYAAVDNNLTSLDYTCHNNNYPDVAGHPVNFVYIPSPGNNVVADPLLCRNGDIRKGSPCIDAGSAAYAPATDVYGQPRNPDIGSMEFLDQDDDGLPDVFEKKYFGNNTIAVASDNPDADELTNLQEYEASTDPLQRGPDNDRDGLSSDAEEFYRTDPDDWDSDGDLFPDGWEVMHNFDPNSTNSPPPDGDEDSDGVSNFDEMRFGTNPNNPDSDGDGVSDGAEVTNGSDPADGGDLGSSNNCVHVDLVVGDDSGSHTERYALQVGHVYHVSTEWGTLATNTYSFAKNKVFPFYVRWIDTINTPDPDYDYTATIGGIGQYGGTGTGFAVEDDEGILGTHGESTNDFAYGKSGILYTASGPIVMDLDGDFNGDGVIDGNDPDDDEEHTAPGLSVPLNNNDDNENGVPDREETAVSGEADLVKIHLDLAPTDVDSGVVVLAATAPEAAGDIKIWKSAEKGAANLLLDTTVQNSWKTSWALSSTQTFASLVQDLYVEGAEGGNASGAIAIILRYENPESTMQASDRIVVTVTEAELDIAETARPWNRIGWDDPRMLDNIRNKIVIWSTNHTENKTGYDLVKYPDIGNVYYKIEQANSSWNPGYPLEDVLTNETKTISAVHGSDRTDWDFKVSYGLASGARTETGPYEIYAVSGEDYQDAQDNYANILTDLIDQWAYAVYSRFSDGAWGGSTTWHPTSETSITFTAEQPLQNTPYADITHKFGAATFVPGPPVVIDGRRQPQTAVTVPVYFWDSSRPVNNLFRNDQRIVEVIDAFLTNIDYNALRARYDASVSTGVVRTIEWEFSTEPGHQLYWTDDDPETPEVESLTGGKDSLIDARPPVLGVGGKKDPLLLGDVWVVGSIPGSQLYGGSGHISINVEQLLSGDLKIQANPDIDMTVEDMFDFNYFNKKTWLRDLIPFYGNPPTVAASIQCAYGRAGIGSGIGQAALLRFEVKGEVSGIPAILIEKP